MEYRHLLLVSCLAVELTAVGCGATTHSETAPTPPSVTLTAKDNGAIQTLAVGTNITVELAAVENFKWTLPLSSDARIVEQSGGAIGPEGGARATFVVTGLGQATLSAVDNPKCFPVCAVAPGGGWRVTIIGR